MFPEADCLQEFKSPHLTGRCSSSLGSCLLRLSHSTKDVIKFMGGFW